MLDTGLKFYAVPNPTRLSDLEVKVMDLENFLVKVFSEILV